MKTILSPEELNQVWTDIAKGYNITVSERISKNNLETFKQSKDPIRSNHPWKDEFYREIKRREEEMRAEFKSDFLEKIK